MEVTPSAVVVRLSVLDRLVAFSGDINLPRDCVLGARAVDNARREVRPAGVRMLGIGVPGILAGRFGHGAGGVTFAITYGWGPGVVIETREPRFDRIVLTTPHARALAAQLSSGG